MSKLKKLFSYYVHGRSTKIEKEIVDLWYDNVSTQKDNYISDEEAEEFRIDAWRDFQKQLKYKSRIHKKNTFLKYAGVVAASIVVVIVILQFSYNIDENRTVTSSKNENRLSRQFVSEKNMRKITLLDGSVIHMNMGTTISMYKGKFNAAQREVWLDEGEAFFEIAKDPKRPFVVHTPDGLVIKVLGTSFNIKAYKELGEQAISVKTGRVQVNSSSGDKRIVELNNKLVFNNNTKEITTEMTNGADAAAWRSGRIVLDHVNMKELAFRLKQYYDVDLINKSISDEMEIYTSFNQDTPLEHVVNNIGKMFGVTTKIENDTVYIY